MPLKLMYITNSEDVAHIAEEAGVDRIFCRYGIYRQNRQAGWDGYSAVQTYGG